jgi:hypothetical protein
MILLASELCLGRDKRPAQNLTPDGQKVKGYSDDIAGVSLPIAAYRGRRVHKRGRVNLQIITGVEIKPFGLFLMEHSGFAERTESAVIAFRSSGSEKWRDNAPFLATVLSLPAAPFSFPDHLDYHAIAGTRELFPLSFAFTVRT